jgi:ribosomal RNA-processing protein 12
LKDSNGKTREAAFSVLLSMASRFDIVQLIQVILSALGSETSHMRSAVVVGLSRIIFELGNQDENLTTLIPDVLQTILLLMDEQSREVAKSVVGFIRICVARIPRHQIEPLLPDIIGGLFSSKQTKGRFREKVKIILKKLVKSFGYDALMPFVPKDETRLLTHMRKLEEREKRKKQQHKDSSNAPELFDDMIDSDEEDSVEGRTLMTGATGLSRNARTNMLQQRSAAGKSMSATSAKSKHMALKTNLCIPDETAGEVVDMLGPSMARRVQFAEEDDEESDSDDAALEFDDDGKLVISNPDNTSDHNVEHLALATHKKRKLDKDAVMSRSVTGKSKPGAKKKEIGSSYKAKKAGGDARKKGQKYEPFAFVPLDARAYTKKNRASAVEQMSSVVRKGGKRKR